MKTIKSNIKNNALNNILETKQKQIQKLKERVVDFPDDGWKGYIKTKKGEVLVSYIKCCKIIELLKRIGDTTHANISYSHWKLNANGYYKNQPEVEISVKKKLADNLSRVEGVLKCFQRRKTIFCADCVKHLDDIGIVCQWGSNWMWTTKDQVAKEQAERTKRREREEINLCQR